MRTQKNKRDQRKSDGEGGTSDGTSGHLETWQKGVPGEGNSVSDGVKARKCGICGDSSLTDRSLMQGLRQHH